MRKNLGSIVIAVFIMALSTYALFELLQTRFSSGDIYPKYSSLRSDPFGTKALYESLQDCCDLKLSRNFEDFNQIQYSTNAALFFAGTGVPPDTIPQTFLTELENYMKNGGRLIVTYIPAGFIETAVREAQEKHEEEAKKDPKSKPKKKEPEEVEEFIKSVSLSKRWGLSYKESDEKGIGHAKLVGDAKLPKVLNWHSPVYFDLTGKEWNVLYKRQEKAVLVERKFGKGSLVLASDSFFLSNEAMLRDRQPELLVWLIGGKREVIFDEYHLGVASSSGVAALSRRYRLHGLAAGLFVIALLFVWMNSTSLVPAYSSAEVQKKISGKDSVSGLANLLRRSVSAKEIFALCCTEWRKTISNQKQPNDVRIQRVDDYLNQNVGRRNVDPVVFYNRISEILKLR